MNLMNIFSAPVFGQVFNTSARKKREVKHVTESVAVALACAGELHLSDRSRLVISSAVSNALYNSDKYTSSPLPVDVVYDISGLIERSHAEAEAARLADGNATTAEEPTTSKKEKVAKAEKEGVMTKLIRYMSLHYAFRYNVMTRKPEMMVLDDPNPHYIEIDKREQNSLVIDAQQNGVDCWDLDVDRLIKSTYTKAYHPFIEYFNNLPKWDGVDRVSDLAKRISTKEVWVNGFHRWMLGTVAQWMNIYPEGTANCVAPLLISTEQGWGKSTFCRMLMPKELRRYYTESFDLNAPSACESKLADYGLINLDEFDKYSEKKQPALKNLMQRNDLNITRAYQQTTSRLHRIASFIGTSNSRDLMKDKTGSRRFICVELEHEIDCETPIDYPQLYAQLKEELTVLGERHYFSKAEEAQIQKNNRKYYHTSVDEEAFYRHFRFAQKGDEGAQFLTASAIYKQLVKDEGSVLSGISAYKFSCLLSKIGDRVDTKYCNGYYVVRV
jgi:hypothetical protein